MRCLIRRTALAGLLLGLMGSLHAYSHSLDDDSGVSAAAAVSPTPGHGHRHHHSRTSPSPSPADEPAASPSPKHRRATATGDADSDPDVTPAPEKHHHFAAGSDDDSGQEPSPTPDSFSIYIKQHHHPKESPSASPSPADDTPTPSPVPKRHHEPATGETDTEADITPASKSGKHHHPAEDEDAENGTPTPEADITPAPKSGKHHHPAQDEDAENVTPTPEPTPPVKSTHAMASPTPKPRPSFAPDASLDPEALEDYSSQPPKVQAVISAALALTRQNLTYTEASADPANGGLDCSGFVYYVLTQAGLQDVPRDASGQYSWVRKADKFRAVISKSLNGFEMDEIKPGNLLFWTGTYQTDHDPPVTHVMIYLGREKQTGNRVMVGSADGRSYNGLRRWGVSVFDFKPTPASSPRPSGTEPRFIGYGAVPGM